MPTITYQRLHPDTPLPERATEGAAGYDLRAYLANRVVRCSDDASKWDIAATEEGRLTLQPGTMALVPLGFKARLPAGYEAQIRPRSGAAFKRALEVPNAPGTIDADYPDEWMVILRNASQVPQEVLHGDRIAQMVLSRFEVLDTDEGEVGVTSSREGGFGSTGR
jgi:dUTP pyrophosphatase